MNNQYTDRELADALTFLQGQTGFGNNLPRSPGQPQGPYASVPAPAHPSNPAPPNPETAELDVLTNMVQTIESNLRPEGVETLWLMLGQLVFRRQRVNRYELLKGSGFYTLAFCMPWLAIKAVGFPKAIAGTAFIASSQLIFPIVAIGFVTTLLIVYRKPLMLIAMCEIIVGFITSLIIFSLL
jgi:hypothetical protein